MSEISRLIPIQFLSNSALYASSLFIPILAGDLFASDFEVGLIVGAYGLALFMSNYLFGRFSDIHGKKPFLQAGLMLSAVASLIQILGTDIWSLTAARTMVGFCAGMYPSALMAKAYQAKDNKIGKFTSFGAFGWSFGIVIAGILSVYWKIFLFSSLAFFFAFLYSFLISYKEDVKMAVPLFPKAVIKRSLPVYIPMLVRHTGASGIWAIFQLYLHEDLGGSLFDIAILYSINPLGQFFTMQAIDKVASSRLIAAGLLVSIGSFFAMALVTDFWVMVIPWVILSIAWAFLYVGSLKYVMERNIEKATSMGLLNSTINISAIAGALIGGVVAFYLGRVATIVLAMCTSIIALVLFFILERTAPGKQSPA